jgi:hypothetical protein
MDEASSKHVGYKNCVQDLKGRQLAQFKQRLLNVYKRDMSL